MFQKESIGHVGHFQFLTFSSPTGNRSPGIGYRSRMKRLRIFQCHLLEKCLEKAVEAFKVWASKGITTERKFSKWVLRAKRAQKHVKIVSE